MVQNKELLCHHCFQLCLEYAIRKVKANEEGVKMNGIYQFVANADDVNLVGKTIYTTVFT
jgi:hypothetical protein